jgi:hypothetical protein
MGLLLVNLNRKLREKLAEATWKLGNHLIALFEDRGKLKKEKKNLQLVSCSALLCCCRPLQTKSNQNFTSGLGSYDAVPCTMYHVVPCTMYHAVPCTTQYHVPHSDSAIILRTIQFTEIYAVWSESRIYFILYWRYINQTQGFKGLNQRDVLHSETV